MKHTLRRKLATAALAIAATLGLTLSASVPAQAATGTTYVSRTCLSYQVVGIKVYNNWGDGAVYSYDLYTNASLGAKQLAKYATTTLSVWGKSAARFRINSTGTYTYYTTCS